MQYTRNKIGTIERTDITRLNIYLYCASILIMNASFLFLCPPSRFIHFFTQHPFFLWWSKHWDLTTLRFYQKRTEKNCRFYFFPDLNKKKRRKSDFYSHTHKLMNWPKSKFLLRIIRSCKLYLFLQLTKYERGMGKPPKTKEKWNELWK